MVICILGIGSSEFKFLEKLLSLSLLEFKKVGLLTNPKKVNSVTENKLKELRKVSSGVQSTASASLTLPSMQHSRMKRHRIGHHSSKRKTI